MEDTLLVDVRDQLGMKILSVSEKHFPLPHPKKTMEAGKV
jgi:hypothetical protein